MLFGNLLSTISEYDNVMDYYYPLAIYVHESECNLEHSLDDLGDRVMCSSLQESNEEMMAHLDNINYVVSNIYASEDEEAIKLLDRIIGSDANFYEALDELEMVYELTLNPTDFDNQTWNALFKNLLMTVAEDENVCEVYYYLANRIHNLGYNSAVKKLILSY